MDITNKTNTMGTNDTIDIDPIEKTQTNQDRAIPQPRPKLPAYVHPH